ncbi:expressed unknown protein [Seminavis robusta]|uniref:Uncharacterized protein n=1 Tax=Seminavis robusta TaxID=568900 RepID=A0A9N8D4J8_9STRA|nr:expressed unknown protein [Seminavis robusta]|eukprot:Sro3_g002530.1 n/a (162) ;mRNA; r:187186-187671
MNLKLLVNIVRIQIDALVANHAAENGRLAELAKIEAPCVRDIIQRQLYVGTLPVGLETIIGTPHSILRGRAQELSSKPSKSARTLALTNSAEDHCWDSDTIGSSTCLVYTILPVWRSTHEPLVIQSQPVLAAAKNHDRANECDSSCKERTKRYNRQMHAFL